MLIERVEKAYLKPERSKKDLQVVDYKAAMVFASELSELHGLSPAFVQKLAGMLLQNPFLFIILNSRIECGLNTIMSAGYNQEEAAKVLEKYSYILGEPAEAFAATLSTIINSLNVIRSYNYKEQAAEILIGNGQLFEKSKLELRNVLMVLSEYNLDEDAFFSKGVLSFVSAEFIYALTQELKAQDVEVTEETIESLFMSIPKEKVSQVKKELIEKHPLNSKAMLGLMYSYNKSRVNRAAKTLNP